MAAFIGVSNLDSDHLILPEFHRIQQTLGSEPRATSHESQLFL